MAGPTLFGTIVVIALSVVAALYIQKGMANWFTESGYLPSYTDEMVTEFCKQKIGSSPVDGITESVYLGDMCGASEWSSISHRHISKLIVACARCPVPRFASKVQNKDLDVIKFNLRPVDDVDILSHLPKAVAYIEDAVAKGQKVFVSSLEGRTRSAAIVAAYLIKARGLNVKDAVTLMQQKRPIVELPLPILRQLESYKKQVILLAAKEKLQQAKA